MERESVLQRPIIPEDPLEEDIHHSIADADDMEEVWDEEISVRDVCLNVLHHPLQLITRWNWKSVLLAVIIRSLIYVIVYTASSESSVVILTAVAFESISRFLTTGVAGALVQSFRKAKPIWLANVIVSIILPAFSHTVEFLTHYCQERYFSDMFAASQNSGREKTFPISVLFSVVSVLFNLYAMRNGALLVGAGKATQTLRKDFTQIPRLLAEFVISLPVYVSRFIERGKFLNALATIVVFGAAVGTILGSTRGMWKWAWRSALGAWALLLAVTALTYVLRIALGHARREQERA
jgi:hypothetical protein